MRLANKISLGMLGLMALSGCNKDGPAPVPPAPPPPATFTVGGTLSGLNGSVTLANNGGDSRALSANGAFTFPTAAQTGAAYNVTVTAQPANQTCAVTSGTGTVAAANVSAIAVACVTNTFTVGGAVTGLNGGGLVLRNNAGNDLTRDADGAFTFTTAVAAGSPYAVTIATQPANQTCSLANESGVIAAANVSNVSVTCATFRITGVIGPAGGSLVGPDGVEVHIPAGALSQPTTIGIARSPGGWPEPLIADETRFGSIYELTPHNVVFDKPVIVRLPAPNGAADPYALVSSFNEGWQRTDVAINGNFAEMERNVFSWLYIVSACAPEVGDLYPCSLPRGYSYATATPANAISMTSGVPVLQGNGFYMQSSAGTWAVDSSLLTTLHINMEYDAAPDCGNAHVQLKRLLPGATPPTQIISDQIVTLDLQGNGRTTLNIPAADLPDGTRGFAMRFDCTRPGGPEHGGADWITFNVSPNPVPGFTVGGSIAGLTAAGLELQNYTREILPVPAGSTSFTFGTPLAAGANYNVRVRTQPVNQLCTIARGSGQVAAAVSNIAVTCQSTLPAVQKLALVVNSGSNNMSILTRNPDSGRLTPLATIGTGSYPFDVAVTPNGQFAYVANTVGESVSSFRINGTTVTSIPQSTRGTTNPYGLTVDPNGRFLRVANYSAHTVSSFEIDNATGLLTARGSVQTGTHPYAVMTHPNGNFVYTVDESGSSSGPTISGFSVNPATGELTSLGSPSLVPAYAPQDLVISPNGAFIFALSSQARVGRMSINTSTGALTSGPSTTINGSSGASCIAIHPDGNHLYVGADSSSGGFIQVFSVDGVGALTAINQVPTGRGKNCIAIDASGDFMYVTNSADKVVNSFSIDQNGALTLLESDPVGTSPEAVALTP